jgi:predicted nucleotidyltransferase
VAVVDYEKLIATLVTESVEFIIVGGAAATAHGSARFTEDLDIVYSRRSENIKRLVEALQPLQPRLRGAPASLPFRWDEETIAKGLNFTLTTSSGWLDLLGEITLGGNFEQLLAHSVKLNIFGHECLCLGLQRLIEVKRAAARRKDFEAIAELQVILEELGTRNSKLET